ncbi:hypothetical protein D7V86_24450 [bacterium D16-51]|nr:hypothetical protein D7V96_24815 [bacterium D16-59]RKI53928.1 hypothetical protein D7V86_24450 [bacterium D16-51]
MALMSLANLNLTFGSDDEPLLEWLDEFIIPALTSGIKREIKNKEKKEPTYIMFNDVSIDMVGISEKELVLKGLIIKDTTLDIYNQYNDNDGLYRQEQHPKSAPYSVFVIFLKNHRMALIKNQAGSPDIRLFTSTLRDILTKYRKEENKRRKETGLDYLPTAIINSNGIKSSESISNMLKNIKRIREVTFTLTPRNNELGGLSGLVDKLEAQLLEQPKSKCVKTVIKYPNSTSAVTKLIEETDGMMKTEIYVDYPDEIDESGQAIKRNGKIRDDEITQKFEVEFSGELKESFDEIIQSCEDIEALHKETDNIIYYNKYMQKRKEQLNQKRGK